MYPELLVIFSLFLLQIQGDEHHHPRFRETKRQAVDEEEISPDFWRTQAINTIKNKLSKEPNKNIAKNVILFLGDGMSVPTITAARAYTGDEANNLSFDNFPHTALSKTYSVDEQVSDSACTATAYLTGVKANYGTIGVSAAVSRGDCLAMANSSNHIPSIAYYSQLKGKATGLVTTTTVTHASPAGVYAHTSERDWEADSYLINDGADPSVCDDIAKQLIMSEPGKNLNVIMGGGRTNFISSESVDDEGNRGRRVDGVDLIQTWLGNRNNAEYVWNREQLLNINEETEFSLGLFAASHLPYNQDRNPERIPSLEEMTEAAIKILSKNPNGYFLFVEGGRIDLAHHESRAYKALNETVEFAKAIEKAVNLTSEEDTLIVVTADHSHTLSFSGYSSRRSNVVGLADNGRLVNDHRPYTILNYANGPGAIQGERPDLSETDFSDFNFVYPAVVPMSSETHGGDDVVIFARGPWAHLYSGVLEQNVIPHIMSFASCVGNFTACDADVTH